MGGFNTSLDRLENTCKKHKKDTSCKNCVIKHHKKLKKINKMPNTVQITNVLFQKMFQKNKVISLKAR